MTNGVYNLSATVCGAEIGSAESVVLAKIDVVITCRLAVVVTNGSPPQLPPFDGQFGGRPRA